MRNLRLVIGVALAAVVVAAAFVPRDTRERWLHSVSFRL